MTVLHRLPLKTLRIAQRTLSAGLRAVYWHTTQENCGKSLTHVSSLHFLIHFVHPRTAYRRLHVDDLLSLCGFDSAIDLHEAMNALQA